MTGSSSKFNFRSAYYHPWIIISYYLAYQYIINIHQLKFEMFLIPELLCLLLVTTLFFLINRLIHDLTATAIIMSIGIIISFSYSSISSLFPALSQFESNNSNSFENALWISFIVSIIILIGSIIAVVLALRKITWFKGIISVFFNILSLILFATIIGLYVTKKTQLNSMFEFRKEWKIYLSDNAQLPVLNPNNAPDIYLIILDGYGSTEVLNEIYKYDNSPFVKGLNTLGFTIIPEARANYSQTRIVFSSMLNMNNINELLADEEINSVDARPLIEIIKSNLAMQQLENLGYTTISFSSGFAYTEDLDTKEMISTGYKFSDIERQILRTTIFYPLLHNSFYKIYRKAITETLIELGNMSNYPSPKFVFAHICCPHPPFIFNEDGEFSIPPIKYYEFDADDIIGRTSNKYYYEGYRNQVEYISNQILVSVISILKNSDPDPVIIIMGDHGPGLTVSQVDLTSSNHYERMHILNALYLPGVDPASIPADLTPVNTFRFIFNQYFGTTYELLENKSYASPYNRPFDFIDVTELLNINLAPGK